MKITVYWEKDAEITAAAGVNTAPKSRDTPAISAQGESLHVIA